MKTTSILLFGIPFHCLTLEETIENIFQFCEKKIHSDFPSYVATANIQFIFNIFQSWPPKIIHPELLSIIRNASLITADGMPLVWLSRLLRTPLPERVAGADLLPKIAERAAKEKRSLYFFGGIHKTAEEASLLLKKRFPALQIAGISSPFIQTEGFHLHSEQEQDEKILQEINQSRADILLIGLGNPKQEIWFERIKYRLKVSVAIGVGGSFAFVTGHVKRAPHWIQKLGFEWLFRLFQEPKRLWKRYLGDLFPLFSSFLPLFLYFWATHIFSLKNSSRNQDRINNQELANLFYTLKKWPQQKECYSLLLQHSPRSIRWMKMNVFWDYVQFKQTIQKQKRPSNIYIQENSHSYILEFVGELNSHFNFQEKLKWLTQSPLKKTILIDLEDCFYLDNSLFCFLSSLYEKCKKDQQHFFFADIPRKLFPFFKQTKFLRLLPIPKAKSKRIIYRYNGERPL